jgi:AraC-like DNA-binding protein
MARIPPLTPHEKSAEAFDIVHDRMLCFFPDLVEKLGGNPNQLMAAAGLDAGDHARCDPCVAYRQVLHLMERAAETLRCADFGMRLATLQSGRMFGPLGQVMRNSRTFGEALDYVSKHGGALSMAARFWLTRRPAEAAVFAGHDILLDGIPHKTQAVEQMLLLGHLSAIEITGGRVRARKVHFRHQPVSSPMIYRRYFGCDVCFGQQADGVVYLERDLAAPVVDPDVGLYDIATSFIDATLRRRRPLFQGQVRSVVMQLLGGERCRSDCVAAELNLHPQTLLRRLKEEGTSFQKIKDEVRRDLMLYYVQQTDLEFTYISERLGFAEQSVMTRLCRRWFDLSPTQLRAQAARFVEVAGPAHRGSAAA